MNSIDRSSDRPLYKQLADLLRNQIISGELPPGTDLPSEAELMRTYGIARNTVKEAIGQLRAEGLVVSARGRLTQVRPIRVVGTQRYTIGKTNYGPDIESAFAREHGVPWSEFEITRKYRIVPAPARVALALRLDPDEEVYERQFTHATGGVMLRMSQSYLSVGRFADTVLTNPDEPLWPGGTVAQMNAIGINVTRVRVEVTTRPPSSIEAECLHLAASAWVLESWRTQFAGNDPVETAQHVYPPTAPLLVFDIPVGSVPTAAVSGRAPTAADESEWLGWAGPSKD